MFGALEPLFLQARYKCCTISESWDKMLLDSIKKWSKKKVSIVSPRSLKEATKFFEKFVVGGVHGLLNYSVYSWPTFHQCLKDATRAFKMFVVGGVVGLFDYSVYSWPSFNQKYHVRSGNCLKEETRAFKKFVVVGVGWVGFMIIVSTPGLVITRNGTWPW